MLTYEEVQDALRRIMDQSAEDFERVVADYIPQHCVDQLMMEWLERHVRNGIPTFVAVEYTTNFMCGMQLGWMLAIESKAGRHAS
jgi:hypothetical protein